MIVFITAKWDQKLLKAFFFFKKRQSEYGVFLCIRTRNKVTKAAIKTSDDVYFNQIISNLVKKYNKVIITDLLQLHCTLLCVSGCILLSLHPFSSFQSFPFLLISIPSSHFTVSFFIITFISCTPLLSFPSTLPAAPLKDTAALPVCQQTLQSFIIPLSLFQWKQSTVTVFLYRCRRPLLLFHPFFIPL